MDEWGEFNYQVKTNSTVEFNRVENSSGAVLLSSCRVSWTQFILRPMMPSCPPHKIRTLTIKHRKEMQLNHVFG